MDEHKYVEVFDADVNPIKRKMQELGNFMKNIGESIKETWKGTFSGLVEYTDNPFEGQDLEELQSQLEMYEASLGRVQNAYVQLQKEIGNSKPTKDQLEALKDMEDTSGQLTVRIEQLRETIKRLKEEQEGASKETKKGVLSMIKTWGKFGLALLGVTGTFGVLRKAVSTALANNAELGNKMNAIWTGLGNAITPLLEKFINLILRAYAYLSVFLKALSGGKVDLLAGTSKGASATAKSLKEANKQLAGFDEITNLDTTSGGGGGGGGVSDPFADINLDLEWVKALEDFGNYMNEHWPAVITLLGLTWLWVNKIGKEGIWNIIKTIAPFIVGIGIAIYGVVQFIQDATELLELAMQYEQDPTWENFKAYMEGLGNVIGDVALIIGGLGIAFGGTSALIIAGVLLVVSEVVRNWGYIVEWWGKKKEEVLAGWERLKTGIGQLFNGSWRDGIRNIFAGAFSILNVIFPNIKESAKLVADGIKNLFGPNWKDAIVSIIKGLGNGVISVLNGLIRGINAIAWPIRKLIVGIGSILGYGWDISSVQIPTIPYLATGTNFVPSDQLAYLHKGEAVVPKKFNSQEYFGSNSEMIEKLDTLIEVVNNIDVNPYITIKDVGEASVKYQNQQYRLRGRSLVNG